MHNVGAGILFAGVIFSGERGKGINYVMSIGVFGSALSGKIFTHLAFGYLEIFLFAALLGLMMLPETFKEEKKQTIEPTLN